MTASPGRRAAIAGAGAVVLAAGVVAIVLARRPPEAPPVNVLVVVMDTTRADRCSFLGHFRDTTPALRKLAEEGIVFEDAWSPSTWTAPAHGSLFTGRAPWEIGLAGRDIAPLPKEFPTLASVLSKAGHATACVTANVWIAPELDLVRGFDMYQPTFRGSVAGAAAENHRIALGWMREQHAAGRPFFAFINDMEPHAPYDPPGNFIAKFVPRDVEPGTIAEGRGMTAARAYALGLGVEPLDPELRRTLSALYDGEIGMLDAEIGRLLGAMRAEGFLDNTLVVIVGDHGEGLADHGWIEHSWRVDREILRVPLLVRLPGGARGGTRVRGVVELQDVFPTVLEVCGVAAPPGLSSRSLLDPLPGRVAVGRGGATSDLREAVIEYTSLEAARPLRPLRGSAFDGRFHLVTEEGAPPRLYDVVADPEEARDVSAAHPDEVTRLLQSIPR